MKCSFDAWCMDIAQKSEIDEEVHSECLFTSLRPSPLSSYGFFFGSEKIELWSSSCFSLWAPNTHAPLARWDVWLLFHFNYICSFDTRITLSKINSWLETENNKHTHTRATNRRTRKQASEIFALKCESLSQL